MIFMNYEKINNINFKYNSYIEEIFSEITLTHLPQEILIDLKRRYAGVKSALTSSKQYMYQHFVIWRDPRLSKLADIIKQIAVREAEHYEILAKILVRCGIDPKNCVYIDGNPNLCDYWKASNVSYEKALVKMFESNYVLTKRMLNEYNIILNKTDNENLKQIITRMVQDEEIHLTYFMTVLEELKN